MGPDRTALDLAVVLATVLGFTGGGPWASVAHLAFLAAVVVVGLVSTLSAAIIEWSTTKRQASEERGWNST
jgi:hypothetical protein